GADLPSTGGIPGASSTRKSDVFSPTTRRSIEFMPRTTELTSSTRGCRICFRLKASRRGVVLGGTGHRAQEITNRDACYGVERGFLRQIATKTRQALPIIAHVPGSGAAVMSSPGAVRAP
ncbi:MAG: hypothetical protein K0S78_4832, partial [Thermomicrobiales bacterium]|nr:hypothetical protein [Thermomicrobiales bacterium]